MSENKETFNPNHVYILEDNEGYQNQFYDIFNSKYKGKVEKFDKADDLFRKIIDRNKEKAFEGTDLFIIDLFNPPGIFRTNVLLLKFIFIFRFIFKPFYWLFFSYKYYKLMKYLDVTDEKLEDKFNSKINPELIKIFPWGGIQFLAHLLLEKKLNYNENNQPLIIINSVFIKVAKDVWNINFVPPKIIGILLSIDQAIEKKFGSAPILNRNQCQILPNFKYLFVFSKHYGNDKYKFKPWEKIPDDIIKADVDDIFNTYLKIILEEQS